ncbi:MAG: hypothetical protein NTY04_03255 [Candidatus Staskawiczbacteria bacterium]|nr:hypothetical protein [Candidatus Staskawiczbacteria bacterium]
MKKKSICLATICAIAGLCLACLTACETTDDGKQQQQLVNRGASAINIGDQASNCILRTSGTFRTVDGSCVIHDTVQVAGNKTNIVETANDNFGFAKVARGDVIDPRFIGSKR